MIRHPSAVCGCQTALSAAAAASCASQGTESGRKPAHLARDAHVTGRTDDVPSAEQALSDAPTTRPPALAHPSSNRPHTQDNFITFEDTLGDPFEAPTEPMFKLHDVMEIKLGML